jgi:hypothetical protein
LGGGGEGKRKTDDYEHAYDYENEYDYEGKS